MRLVRLLEYHWPLKRPNLTILTPVRYFFAQPHHFKNFCNSTLLYFFSSTYFECGQPTACLVVVMKLPSSRYFCGLLIDVEESDLVVVADGDDRLARHRREEGRGNGLGVADQRRHRRKRLAFTSKNNKRSLSDGLLL